MENGNGFLLADAFEVTSFGNGATYLKSKTKMLSANDWPWSSPTVCVFYTVQALQLSDSIG